MTTGHVGIDVGHPHQHAVGYQALQSQSKLRELLIGSGHGDPVAYNQPIGDGLVPLAQFGHKQPRIDRAPTQVKMASAIRRDLKTLRGVTHFGQMGSRRVGLVPAIGNRQHDAIPLVVDVRARQGLVIDACQQRLCLW